MKDAERLAVRYQQHSMVGCWTLSLRVTGWDMHVAVTLSAPVRISSAAVGMHPSEFVFHLYF